MPFKFLGDIAVADIAFEAWGATKEEMFQAACEATLKVMVGDAGSVRRTETVRVELDEQNLELLLFDFLNELLFYKDSRRLLLLPMEISLSESEGRSLLRAELAGEEIDTRRHTMETDVKAVTLHRFSVTQSDDGWRCTVVLDV